MTKIKMAIIIICLILSTNVVSAQDYNDLTSDQKADIQEYFQANPGLTSAEKKAYIDGYIKAYDNSEASKEEVNTKEEALMKQYQHNQRTDNRNQRQFNRTSRHIKKDYHDNTQNNSSDN
ncbi:MAG: hypothetical protein AB1782_16320 [Cyanobacteriota bacterium]